MKTKILVPVDGSEFSAQILPCVRQFFAPEDAEILLFRVEPHIHIGNSAEGELARDAMAYSDPLLASATSHHLREHAYQAARHPVYDTQVENGMRAQLDESMLPLVRALRQTGYNVSTAIEFGEPAEQIRQAIAQRAIDLVAMTTHGRRGIEHFLFGSVAEDVLRHTQTPVLLLRPTE